MSPSRILSPVRLLAIGFCLTAVSAYVVVAPAPSSADIEMLMEDSGGVQCTYAGKGYDVGACRGGQRCMTNGNGDPYWGDDPQCPR